MSELAAATSLAKGEEFNPFIKMGRTQLQDAVPMTLGQEFTAFGHTILEDVERLGEACKALIPRDPTWARRQSAPASMRRRRAMAATVCRELSRITGLTMITAPDLVESDRGHRRVRPALRRPQALRGEAVEDLQRLAAAGLRPARRPWRDQPAGGAGGFVDHAGRIGQPGNTGSGEPGVLRRDRRRRRTVTMAAEAGAAAAQRVRAGDQRYRLHCAASRR